MNNSSIIEGGNINNNSKKNLYENTPNQILN